jgi:HAD superfamily hydrolase (TIGR01509 family)
MPKLFLALSLCFSPLFAQEQEKFFVLFDCRESPSRTDENFSHAFLAKNLHLSSEELQSTVSEIRKERKRFQPEKITPCHEKIKESGLHLLLHTAQAISSLKEKGYAVAILTNVPVRKLHSLQKKWISQLFKPTFISCDGKRGQGDVSIYAHALRQLDTPPENCLFIDEEQEHVDAAQTLHIPAILFESPESLQRALSNRIRSQDAEALQPIATAEIGQPIP